MLHIEKLAAVFAIVLILSMTMACEKEESPGTEYMITVDSIFHLDTLQYGEVLTIDHYGLVGPSQCYSFYRFDITFDENTINTSVIGLYTEDSDCVEDSIYLEGAEAAYYNLPAGDIQVKVNLPRGNTLESKLYVRK